MPLSTPVIRTVEIIKFYLRARQMSRGKVCGSRVGAIEKQRHVGSRDSSRNGARGVILLIRHLSRIFMSLNNPKAARVFTREIKSHVQRVPDGNFLFAPVSAKFILPRVGR